MTTTSLSNSLQTSAMFQVALDPIADTQAIFRVALNALSWPGSIRQLPVRAEGAPVNPWAAGLLITLLDHEVALAVDAFPGSEGLETFVRQRTNAAAAGPSGADFVLASADTVAPELPLRLTAGSLDYPDDGATLVLLVNALGEREKAGLRLGLAGPGVPEGHDLRVAGLQAELIEARNQAVAGYPCGIDLMLVDAGGRFAALPRSTRISIMTEEG